MTSLSTHARNEAGGPNRAVSTDARLYEKARAKIVALAKEAGISLRQTYARKAPRLAAQVGRYAHARQFKRMRKALRTLKGYTGRVMRDLRRQIDLIPAGAFRDAVIDALALTSRGNGGAKLGHGSGGIHPGAGFVRPGDTAVEHTVAERGR